MSRMLLAPSRYVQGAGAMQEIGMHAATFGGTKALVTGGKTALSVAGKTIQSSLSEKKIGFHQELFNGECSQKEIDRLVKIGRANGADIVICAGGGKVIDTGKAVAHTMNLTPDTLVDEVEPYLLRAELVVRGPRGRKLTSFGFEHLGLMAPGEGGEGDQRPLFE